MREPANFSLISLPLRNVEHETYISRHLDINFCSLDVSKRKSNRVTTKVGKAKGKLLFKHDNGDLDFRFFKTPNVMKLGATIITSNIGSLKEPASEDHL